MPNITITMNQLDSYGDGWNDAYVRIFDSDGVEVAAHTLEAGASGSDVFQLEDNASYTWSFGGGNWVSEASFTLVDENGVQLASAAGSSAGGTLGNGETETGSFDLGTPVSDGFLPTIASELGEFAAISGQITLTANYTINIWVKNVTLPGQEWSNLYQQVSGYNYILDANYGAIGAGTGPTRLAVDAADPLLVAETFHLVTCVFDGTTIEYYVNGVSIGSTVPGNKAPTVIDVVNGPGGQNFAAVVKDLRLYDMVATAQQVLDSYSTEGKFADPNAQAQAEGDSSPSLTDDLVAVWNFSEGTGDDSVGSANGTVTDITYAEADGITYAEADGSGNKMDLGTPAALDLGTSDFTVSGWANMDSIPTGASGAILYNKGMTSLSSPQFNGFQISFYQGNARFFVGGQGSYSTISEPMSTGQWYHFMGTRSGTTMKFYINGVLVDTQDTGTVKDVTSSLNGTIFSNYNGSWYTDAFDGKLADIRIWSRALSDSEAASVHTTGPEVPVLELTDNLVAKYPLDSDGVPSIGDVTFTASNITYGAGESFSTFPNQNSSYYVDSPYLDLAEEYTLSFWFNSLKDASAASYGFLMAAAYNKKDGGIGGYENWDNETNYDVVVYTGNELGTYGYENDSSTVNTFNSTGYQMTQALYGPGTGWHHMACVFSGGQMTYYINGVQVGSAVSTVGMDKLQVIGSFTDKDWAMFEYMDDFRVWSRALSSDDAAALHAAGAEVAGGGGSDPSVVADQDPSGVAVGDVMTATVDLQGGSLTYFAWEQYDASEDSWVVVAGGSDQVVGMTVDASMSEATIKLAMEVESDWYFSDELIMPALSSGSSVDPTNLPETSVSANQVARWLFEDDYVDGTSGSSIEFGVVGSPSFVDGKHDGTKAVQLDQGDYFSFPATLDAASASGWSFAFWLKEDGNGTQTSGPYGYEGNILTDSTSVNASKSSINLPHANGTTMWDFDTGVNSGYARLTTGAIALADFSDWVHIVATKDKASGLMKLYKNGVLVASSTKNANLPSITASFKFGYGWAGIIDSIEIYDIALSDSEALEVYNASEPQAVVPTHPVTQLDSTAESPSGDVGFAKGDKPAFYIYSPQAYDVWFMIDGSWAQFQAASHTGGMSFKWPANSTRCYVEKSASDQYIHMFERDLALGYLCDSDDVDSLADSFHFTGSEYSVVEHSGTVSGQDVMSFGSVGDVVQVMENGVIKFDYAVNVGAESTSVTPPAGRDGFSLVVRVFTKL